MDNQNQRRRHHLLKGASFVLGLLFVGSGQTANYYDIAIDPFAKYKKVQPVIPGDGSGDDSRPAYYKDVLAQSNVSYDITPETTGLIGEQIDLNSGSVSFAQTDLIIPGNSKLLPITVRRSFSDANFKQKATAEFADWSLDLPSIHTTVLMPGTPNAGSWGKGLECSGVQRPGAINYKGQVVDAPQYWNGTTLLVDGSQKHLLYRGTSDITYITKDHWKATCFKKADGTGEGYKVTAPNGVVYTFDVPHAVRNFTLNQDQLALPIYHLYLRVSQITDPHGNWVKYKYTSYLNANQKTSQRLNQIESSDGRLVTFTYHTQANQEHLIKTLSANGRTWQYQYSEDLIPSLSKVHLPVETTTASNPLYWEFDLHELTLWHNPLFNIEFQEMQRLCQKSAMEVRGQIKHPHGAKAEFILKPVLHGRTRVPAGLDNSSVDKDSRCFITLGLQKKTLTGPGLDTMNWSYSYSENRGAYSAANDEVAALVQLDGYSSSDLKTTTVTAPDGSKTLSVFFRGWNYQEGEQVGTIYFDTDGTTELKRQWTNADPRSDQVGQPLIDTEFSANPASLTQPSRPNLTTIQLSNAGQHSYRRRFSQYNQFDIAEQETESNTLGGPERTIVSTYVQDLQNWMLNLLKNRQVTQAGQTYSEYSAVYFAANSKEKSLLQREGKNGLSYRSFTYHPDGTLQSVTYDVASRWIAFSNYKRGKPQTIVLPNRYDFGNFRLELQQINDNGTVAWASDLNGNKTNYSYDSQNRLTLIDPVDARWDNTVIRYSSDAQSDAALVQQIEQGNYRKTITLDGLLQPVLTKEWDASDEAASARYVNQRFNTYGKPSFSSVVSNDPTESYGIETSYDGLQRIVTQTNTEQGDVEFSYPANNSVVVENGRGFKTTTHYLAYGEPATNLVTQIVQPEGVTTQIEYNIAGLPTLISQGGLSEIRRYDDYMRYCMQKRPDTGIKVIERNTLGDITRFAEGATGAGTHCRDYAVKNTNWVGIAYDYIGDVNFVAYADNSTPTTTRQLDRQGNLLKLSVGNTVWDYSYNSKHLTENETLKVGAKTYPISNTYDRIGNLKTMQYGGAIVEFAPNAFGLPTKVADSTSYASQIQYHASGQLKSFNFGNGLKFLQLLNAEFKPYERSVQKGAVNRFAQRYQYDATDNLTAITDLVQGSQSVVMSYDGLERLKTATGAWGAGAFEYDATGNILTKQLGNQKLVYSYDGTSKHLSSVTGGYAFSYDDRSNVTHNGKLAFNYNRANQLINAANLSYSYDGHGRRVMKTSAAATAYSVYNQAGKLLMTDGANGLVRYIYLGNDLIAKVGSSLALEDKPGFTGHVEDKTLGLTYMQQRYYDPVIGRFYSNDPVGFSADNPMMFNRYAYANNNPYKYTDPDGRTAIPFPLTPIDTGVGPTGVQDLTPEQQTQGAAIVAGALAGGLALNGAKAAVMSLASRTTTVGRGQQVGQMIKSDGSTKASDIKAKAESVGFKPTQSANGPLKMVDENGTARVTIKGGSERTPGSEGPHVELKDSSGQRVNPAGEAVTRSSPGNHTPITNDL